jgi:hypothetical protein
LKSAKNPPPLDNFWLETGQNTVKEAISRQEEAAKQLIGITSILQATYFAAISFSNLKNALASQNLHGWILGIFIVLFVLPITLWLISLGFAANVLMPVIRYYQLDSPTEIQKTYEKASEYRKKQLERAYQMLVLGFLLLVVSIIVYLAWLK